MRKLAVILCLGALTGNTFAQGLVNFFNSPTTLSSTWYRTNGSFNGFNFVKAVIHDPPGTWYYGLLTAPPGTTDPFAFSFSGAYATNLSVDGRFSGGGNVPIMGWAPGESMSYEVAMWSSFLGHDWQAGWLRGGGFPAGPFGLSAIGTGNAGGGLLPVYNLFGGSTGIHEGLSTVIVPEPASFALALFGAAVLLFVRRWKY